MLESVLIQDLAFYRRDDVPAGIDWWASAEPDHPISIVIEPAGPIDEATTERAASIIRRTPGVLRDAAAWLVEQLASWDLSADERAGLSVESFADPEIMIWDGTEWMVRFECESLVMAAEWGIGVRYEGDVPVAVEDLSDADDEH